MAALTISGDAMMYPMRQPVIMKFFEKLFSVTVRFMAPGKEQIGTKGPLNM